MEAHDHVIIRWQRILVEVLSIWVIVYAIHIISDETPNNFGFTIWLISTMVVYAIMKVLLKHQLRLMHFVIISPLFVLIAYLVEIPLYISFFLSGFIAWRMILHEDDPYLENESFFLGISAFITFVGHLVGIYQGNENANGIVIVLILQLVILLIGRLLYQLFPTQNSLNLSSYKKGLVIISLLTVLFGSAGLALAIFPYIKQLYYIILNGALQGLVTLISPVFQYLSGFFQSGRERLEENLENQQMNNNEEQTPFPEDQGEPIITSEHLLIGFIIIVSIILIIILIINRKKLLNVVKGEDQNNEDIIVESQRVKQSKGIMKRKVKVKKPTNEVRQAFFEMENWAAKFGMGRYVDETIQDWLKRYQLSNIIDQEAIQIYYGVRYGNSEVTKEQKNKYLTQIEQIKQQLKNEQDEQK